MSDLSLVNSAVMYRVAGRTYPMNVNPRCHTCRSPYRSFIENQILCGYTYKQISESLPEDLRLNPRQISDHYRHGHMPLAEAARRAIVEQRATQNNLDTENGLDNLVDSITVLQTIVRDGSDRLARREIEPNVKELMAAAETLLALERDGESVSDWEEITQGIQHVMSMAKSHMTSEQFLEFSRDIVTSPFLKQLMGEEPVKLNP